MKELELEITKIEIEEGKAGRGLYITAKVENPAGANPKAQKMYNKLHIGGARLVQKDR